MTTNAIDQLTAGTILDNEEGIEVFFDFGSRRRSEWSQVISTSGTHWLPPSPSRKTTQIYFSLVQRGVVRM